MGHRLGAAGGSQNESASLHGVRQQINIHSGVLQGRQLVSVARIFATGVLLYAWSPAAFAGEPTPPYEIIATLGVDTVNVFRGSRSHKLNPSAYGVIEFSRGSIYAGLYASPVSIQDEVTANLVGYWGVAPSAFGIDWDIGGRYYAFPGTSDFRFDLDADGMPEKIGRKGLAEASVEAQKTVGQLSISTAIFYSPNMFGETGPAYYAIGETQFRVNDTLKVKASVGHSGFSDDVYNDDYSDYAIGIYKSAFGFDMFVRYSDTAGLAGADNQVVVFGIERSWTIASRAMDHRRFMRAKIRNDVRIDKSQLIGGRR